MIFLECAHRRLVNMNDGLVLKIEREVKHVTYMQHLTRHLSRQTHCLCRKVNAEQTFVQYGIRLADDNVIARSRRVHLASLHCHTTRSHHNDKKKIELYCLQLREVAQVVNYDHIIVCIVNKLTICQLSDVRSVYFVECCHIVYLEFIGKFSNKLSHLLVRYAKLLSCRRTNSVTGH